MIASARSGRPRARTSRAARRSGTGRLEVAVVDAIGQSGASRSSGAFKSIGGEATRAFSGATGSSQAVGQAREQGHRRPSLRRGSGRRSYRSRSPAPAGRLRAPTIAAHCESRSERPSEAAILSHRGMNARADSASPLRIASRIQGSAASLSGDPPEGLERGRLLAGSDRPGPARPGAGPGSRGRRQADRGRRSRGAARARAAGSPPPRGARARAAPGAGRSASRRIDASCRRSRSRPASTGHGAAPGDSATP